ncbi:cytochrome b [Pseudoalteromonas denitrificans]|uniref:Cytochrome b561 n=1 Tax=Pseudoalteromonas denitrificans DSM 6059 TaxID=1123010 RepID=A0A1I1NYF9_9GAMM|nr:cytochrome b/b6 domain-containing protein [Pseudoalteromonas denitrificans]SFC98750.1 cytochrome b561 [Pseudoalteromonas denitrificans DSM 6059]
MNQHNYKVSSPSHYDLGYKILHWLMAILIFLMFFAVEGFASITSIDEHMVMLIGHSSIGTVISILLIMRMSKRFIIKSKRPIHDLNQWQKNVSKVVHIALYFCMALIPLSGYLAARAHELPVKLFGTFNLSQTQVSGFDKTYFETLRLVHELGIKLIFILLTLHIGAVLYHKFIRKDQVLSAMTKNK